MKWCFLLSKEKTPFWLCYGFSYEPYSNNQHKSFCGKDEEYVLEDHSFDSDGVCKDCRYIKQN